MNPVPRPRHLPAGHRLPTLLLFLAYSLSLLAIQFRPVPIPELATRADRICHGRVDAVEVVREPSGTLLTRVEFSPVSTWKGPATNRITFVQPGGTLGTRRVLIPGQPTPNPGDELVLFLARNPRGEFLVLDVLQGYFQVERSGTNAFVRNPSFGGPDAPGGYRPPHLLPLPLESLRQRVTEALP